MVVKELFLSRKEGRERIVYERGFSKQIKKSNFLFQGIHAIPIKGV